MNLVNSTTASYFPLFILRVINFRESTPHFMALAKCGMSDLNFFEKNPNLNNLGLPKLCETSILN